MKKPATMCVAVRPADAAVSVRVPELSHSRALSM